MIPVPPLPAGSMDDPQSQPLRLELDVKALNVQSLLLQAAAHNAAVQLGMPILAEYMLFGTENTFLPNVPASLEGDACILIVYYFTSQR